MDFPFATDCQRIWEVTLLYSDNNTILNNVNKYRKALQTNLLFYYSTMQIIYHYAHYKE